MCYQRTNFGKNTHKKDISFRSYYSFSMFSTFYYVESSSMHCPPPFSSNNHIPNIYRGQSHNVKYIFRNKNLQIFPKLKQFFSSALCFIDIHSHKFRGKQMLRKSYFDNLFFLSFACIVIINLLLYRFIQTTESDVTYSAHPLSIYSRYFTVAREYNPNNGVCVCVCTFLTVTRKEYSSLNCLNSCSSQRDDYVYSTKTRAKAGRIDISLQVNVKLD